MDELLFNIKIEFLNSIFFINYSIIFKPFFGISFILIIAMCTRTIIHIKGG